MATQDMFRLSGHLECWVLVPGKISNLNETLEEENDDPDLKNNDKDVTNSDDAEIHAHNESNIHAHILQ